MKGNLVRPRMRQRRGRSWMLIAPWTATRHHEAPDAAPGRSRWPRPRPSNYHQSNGLWLMPAWLQSAFGDERTSEFRGMPVTEVSRQFCWLDHCGEYL